MKKIECRLMVFAKAPIPGQVKTRLIPIIGEEAAAALHEKLVSHCLTVALKASVGPVELWCSPSSRHPFFIHCMKEFRVELHTQPKGDLGRRMAFAFGKTLKKSLSALLIGTDSPSINPDDLKEAVATLALGLDAVITPAEDGGYVLIGLRQEAPDLFSGISWGTNTVMEETRLRLRRLKWRWRELPQVWDVDRPEDIERLKMESHFIFCKDSL
jgi:rSAM/selenodomain-associated transferase 1